MRRPRNPVPPNTVTVRSFVAAMDQFRQFMSELSQPFRSRERNASRRPSVTWATDEAEIIDLPALPLRRSAPAQCSPGEPPMTMTS